MRARGLSVFTAAGLAAISWMIALTHLSFSRGYPQMILSFALVLVGSAVWLGESLSWPKVLGVTILTLGLIVSTR